MLAGKTVGQKLHPANLCLEVQYVARRLRGGSQSRLVRCTDGNLHVLKMNGNPQGPNVLANEALGSYLLRGLGLSVPRTVPIYLSASAIAQHDLFFETPLGRNRAKAGWHLAIEFVNTKEQALFAWVPASYRSKFINLTDLLAIYIFDVWTSHQDERQCVFEHDPITRSYRVWPIDNGHLFGGPQWKNLDTGPRGATSVHVVAPETMDFGVHRCFTQFRKYLPQLLEAGLESIPEQWYKGDLAALKSCLLSRLENLGHLVAHDISDQRRKLHGWSHETSPVHHPRLLQR